MALNEARRLKLDSSLAVIGLPCASFSIMCLKCTKHDHGSSRSCLWEFVWFAVPKLRSRHTSGRTAINPGGNDGYGFVHVGNTLLARVVLLVLVFSYRQCRWLLEHPIQSCILDHPLLEWLLQRVPAAGLN